MISEPSLGAAARRLAEGATTSRRLVEEALSSALADPRAFTLVDADGARREADLSDLRRRQNRPRSDLDGLPVTVKDLFDVAGQTTSAGSALLRTAPPATADAAVVSRLKSAGLVIIGRTHMSEFAFTGLGLNPHYPPLPNPTSKDRVPGGSSGGAAVSVALGQALAALGTDTGGSVRIPAAFCGLVGFKPTQRRVSRAGVYPLAPSLDSVGPIARTVDCCRRIDAVIADEEAAPRRTASIRDAVIGVPDQDILEDPEPAVAEAFAAALARLERAGAVLRSVSFSPLADLPRLSSRGALANAEAFAFHRRSGTLDRAEEIDSEVRARILLGGEMSAADYLDLLEARRVLRATADALTSGLNALALPVTPGRAPKFADLSSPEAFRRENARALRLPSVFNFLDRCAISLPMATEGAPAGLMLVGETLGDGPLLDLAEAAEPLVAG